MGGGGHCGGGGDGGGGGCGSGSSGGGGGGGSGRFEKGSHYIVLTGLEFCTRDLSAFTLES